MAHDTNLRALVLDRIMGTLIPGGGLMTVAAVCTILVFLVAVAVPAFLTASGDRLPGPTPTRPLAAAFVEGREAGWWVETSGPRVWQADGSVIAAGAAGFGGSRVAASAPAPGAGVLGVLLEDGLAALLKRLRTPKGEETTLVLASLEIPPCRPEQVAFARDDAGGLRVAAVTGGTGVLYAAGPMGDAVESALPVPDVTAARFSGDGLLLALGAAGGDVHLFDLADVTEPKLLQVLPGNGFPTTVLAFLIGDETLVAGDESGSLASWFRVRHIRLVNDSSAEVAVLGDRVPAGGSVTVKDRDHAAAIRKGEGIRIESGGMPWLRTRTFPRTSAAPRAITESPRNRTFAVACSDGTVQVYHATVGRLQLQFPSGVTSPTSILWNDRGDRLAVTGDTLAVWSVRNPFPEVSIPALFLPVWYEGYSGPEIIWQSSSGSQDTEPKLSLWPLIVGTLKGTIYAMVFSVPIAILAAIYVARFAPARLKAWVKPAIEIMSGIPSVVVGMVAALWLAPLVERHLFPAALGTLLFPGVFAGIVALGGRVRAGGRIHAVAGAEVYGAAAAILATLLLTSMLAPSTENLLFRGDFRQWLFEALGINYDIRNCFIVGVALGFAVIPIIFTIAEDSLSGIPPSLTNAAMALGATRWQTVRHVVLPAAASGIFAAIVLGLGRAAGETMIVVMAAGNTPILDFAPWNGMRTMSAAMAIEIPEAPHGGTLYRVLFLTGVLLFLFTASLNTLAEVVGTRLRRKYGRF